MLWIKRIVGLLCVAALVVSGVHLALMMEPVFKGGRVVRYYVGNINSIAYEAETADINKIDTAALVRMTNEAARKEVYSGWAAAGPLLFDGIPTKIPPQYVLLTVLIKDNRVIATYPAELADHIPSSVDSADDWYGSLQAVAQAYLDGQVVTEAWGVHNDSGQQVGQLIALWPESNEQVLGIPIASRYSSPWYIEYPNNTRAVDPVLRVRVLVGLLSFLLLLPLWVGFDASWRGMRPWVWGLLTLVTGLIGLLAYLIARLAPPRPCPNCGEPVLAKFKRCPVCGVALLPPRCPVCRTRLKPAWQHCPVCAEGQPEEHRVEIRVPLAQVPQPVDAEASAVRIMAQDADTHKMVQDAQVSIEGPTLLQGRTNLTGVFDARRLKSGSYTVAAVKDGYETAQASFNAGEGGFEVIEVIMKPLPGGISGRVMSHDSSQAVAGARVFLDTLRVDRGSTTDARGVYLLTDVPAGPYTVRVESEGFSGQSKLVQVNQGAGVALDFALETEDKSAEVGQVR